MKKLIVLLLTLAILAIAGVFIAVTAQADDSLPPRRLLASRRRKKGYAQRRGRSENLGGLLLFE